MYECFVSRVNELQQKRRQPALRCTATHENLQGPFGCELHDGTTGELVAEAPTTYRTKKDAKRAAYQEAYQKLSAAAAAAAVAAAAAADDTLSADGSEPQPAEPGRNHRRRNRGIDDRRLEEGAAPVLVAVPDLDGRSRLDGARRHSTALRFELQQASDGCKGRTFFGSGDGKRTRPCTCAHDDVLFPAQLDEGSGYAQFSVSSTGQVSLETFWGDREPSSVTVLNSGKPNSPKASWRAVHTHTSLKHGDVICFGEEGLPHFRLLLPPEPPPEEVPPEEVSPEPALVSSDGVRLSLQPASESGAGVTWVGSDELARHLDGAQTRHVVSGAQTRSNRLTVNLRGRVNIRTFRDDDATALTNIGRRDAPKRGTKGKGRVRIDFMNDRVDSPSLKYNPLVVKLIPVSTTCTWTPRADGVHCPPGRRQWQPVPWVGPGMELKHGMEVRFGTVGAPVFRLHAPLSAEAIQLLDQQRVAAQTPARGSKKAAKRERAQELAGDWNPRCADQFEIASKTDAVGTRDVGRRILELLLPNLFPEEGDLSDELSCVRAVKCLIEKLDFLSGNQQAFLLSAITAEREGGSLLVAAADGVPSSTAFVRWFVEYLEESICQRTHDPVTKKRYPIPQWHVDPPSMPCEYLRFAEAFADRVAQEMMARRVAQRHDAEWKACLDDFHATFNPGAELSVVNRAGLSRLEFDAERAALLSKQICPHFTFRICDAPCRNGRRHEPVDAAALEAFLARWPKQTNQVYERRQEGRRDVALEKKRGIETSAKATRSWRRLTRLALSFLQAQEHGLQHGFEWDCG
jgi:hypothetical protein